MILKNIINISVLQTKNNTIKQYWSNNITIKNGIIFSFFSFLNSGISFLILLVLAKFLPPSEYGRLNLFNSLVVVLNIFIILSSDGLISIEFFKCNIQELRKFINSSLLITTGIFFFLSIIIILFSSGLESFVGIISYYQWIALLVCFFQSLPNLALNIWRLEEKPLLYGLFSLFVALLNLALTLLFVISIKWGWAGRVYAQLFTGIVFFIICFYILVKKKYISMAMPSKRHLISVLAFGIPLIPHSLSFWLKQGLDRYIINYYHAAFAVGIFSFSLNISNILQIIGVAFNATNSVYIYKKLSINKSLAIPVLKKQAKMMIFLFAFLAILLFLGSLFFIPIIFPKYTKSLYTLPFLIGSSFFQCVYFLFVNYLFYYKKNTALMIITFTVSLIHCGLSFWLTRYSLEYTAVISFFSSFFTTMCVFVVSRKYCRLF